MSEAIKNRYDFVYLFDVENGNPNGDPDADNMPRIDPETNHGIVTDVCLKRKIRNYVLLTKGDISPYRIYIKERAILNKLHEEAYQKNNIPLEKGKRIGGGKDVETVRNWMCENYYDVRTFGAVMSTEINCGTVKGPVQFGFAKSIDPVTPLDITITRCAVATEEESETQAGGAQTMGRKHIIPYALYRAEGFVSACLAEKTLFNTDDLELLWEALLNMFDHDRSAARGKMSARKLIIFEHESKFGNAHASELFELVKIHKKPSEDPPRSFEDYTIEIPRLEEIPIGVKLIEKL